jgi:hypothetical protein
VGNSKDQQIGLDRFFAAIAVGLIPTYSWSPANPDKEVRERGTYKIKIKNNIIETNYQSG